MSNYNLPPKQTQEPLQDSVDRKGGYAEYEGAPQEVLQFTGDPTKSDSISGPASLIEVAKEVPVEDITSDEIQQVVANLRATLFRNPNETPVEESDTSSKPTPRSAGIAAPQIGVSKQIVLISCHLPKEDGTKGELELFERVIINPKIERYGAAYTVAVPEGCLSHMAQDEHGRDDRMASLMGFPERHESITITFYDEHGNKHEDMTYTGLHAQIVEHELSHLLKNPGSCLAESEEPLMTGAEIADMMQKKRQEKKTEKTEESRESKSIDTP